MKTGYVLVGIVIGIIIGIAAPIIFIWWLSVYAFRKVSRLQTHGTRITAIVTKVEPVRRSTSPVTIYHLFAEWQNPKTGKMVTSKTFIKHPAKFPMGSTVSVLIDPENPKWHMLDVSDLT